MRTAAGDPNPRPASPLPLLWQRTERNGGGAYESGQRWAKAGLKVTASHCWRTASRKAPLHLFVLTRLYVRFHLKVATTDRETEMDSATGRGRGRHAICHHGATMLTAAVCGNIHQENDSSEI